MTDFVSLTDIGPTLLDIAGGDLPEQMTGNSLLTILQSGDSGRVDKKRHNLVYGRERHTPAQKKPSLSGYPSRAFKTDKWLLIKHLKGTKDPRFTDEKVEFERYSYEKVSKK